MPKILQHICLALTLGCGLPVVLLLCGCNSEPQAPELRDTPVYENAQEGVRFLVPESWTQTANANLPSGVLEGENFLVRYRVRSPELGAQVQVLCFEDQQTDLQDHHAGPSFGIEKWAPTDDEQSLTIDETEAVRSIYTGMLNKREMTKEVVSFRKAGRVYSFVGTFFSTDEKARQQIRRAVNSVVWD